MKTLYKLCLLLVILINPLKLYANEGWFISAKGGFVVNGPFYYQTTLKYTPTGNTEKNKEFKTNLSDIPSFGISAGYEVDNLIFKVDVERNNFHTKKENTDFTYNNIAVLAGVYYKFDTSSRLVPYIGGGLGFYFRTNLKYKGEPYTTADITKKNNFTGHINVGLSYNISDNIAISIEDKIMFEQNLSFMTKNNEVEYNFGIDSQVINTISLVAKYYLW